MDMQYLIDLSKEDIPKAAKELTSDDIAQLVLLLNEKEDTLRYPSFLLLQSRSEIKDDVYPYWHKFYEKLESDNAYQRSIGLILLARNARWDDAGRLDTIFDRFLSFCDDDKPMVVRLCIQNTALILPFKAALHEKVLNKLLSIELPGRKESQQKLILKDILGCLLMMRDGQYKDAIDDYIMRALNGGLLTKKEKEEINKLLS